MGNGADKRWEPGRECETWEGVVLAVAGVSVCLSATVPNPVRNRNAASGAC